MIRKNHFSRFFFATAFCATLFSCGEPKDKDSEVDSGEKKSDLNLVLRYDKPAKQWMTEALPIGNGFMGAMVYGKVNDERIQFNEESLWAGGPDSWDDYRSGNRKNASKHLRKIRASLLSGDKKTAADVLSKELTGRLKPKTGSELSWEGYGAYQNFGEVLVSVKHPDGKVTDYERNLDLNDATANISYAVGDAKFSRRYFASYPDRVLVFEFETTKPGATEYTVTFAPGQKNATISAEGKTVTLSGNVPDNGMGYEAKLVARAEGGKISAENGTLQVKGAGKMTLVLTAATSYINKYPNYTGKDYKKANAKTLAKIKDKKASSIFADHKSDYQNLFQRVTLDLGGDNSGAEKNTVQRLHDYREGRKDLDFEELYFQYGRYLLISSSRPGSMPANLQGKWNNLNNPPWACDYHMNINEQMIYWPAEATNLAECHEPLIEYTKTLVEPGTTSAKEFFNCRGWIVNTMNNAFGYTAPGWGMPWGHFPAGAAWTTQHSWEHFAYAKDTAFLRDTAYPLMKGAAVFWVDYLVQDKDGSLVSAPSFSPEHGDISVGASMDQQIAWDIFTNTIEASEILGVDKAFRDTLIMKRDKLSAPKIGRLGQLQEWKEDIDDPENKHRHVSHLFALHPGRQISVNTTPKLAEAAKTSLNYRGDSGTGWSLGWKVNFWARLRDGKRARKLLGNLMRPVISQKEEMLHGGGTYNNMLCAHPPFQLDGNMGGTAGIAEMLLQSQSGKIEILPALAPAWQKGKVTGLRARGGFTVDIEWENGKAKTVSLTSEKGGACTVICNGKEATLNAKPGTKYKFDGELKSI
ncbi:hypothetical protein FUAX_03350 [Fulvitalea axinellae]|uniref:Glycoside hydrolase family 95 protein n=1 Tax=Fulvitalea axinellae TaxID=1182444 RepID=A0AAU9CDP2_9BACT|nr:hypothetical protein FUAX_03350 [Fulvitalea axinellae]